MKVFILMNVTDIVGVYPTFDRAKKGFADVLQKQINDIKTSPLHFLGDENLIKEFEKDLKRVDEIKSIQEFNNIFDVYEHNIVEQELEL